MHILITGGAGFIGSHLAERLLKDGHQVTVIDDLSTGRLENIQPLFDNPRFTFIRDTVLNETIMHILMEQCQQIYHLAAAVGVKLIVEKPVHTIETNIRGTEVVLQIASKFRRKVLLASTSEVYGKNSKVPFREEDDRLMGATFFSRWSYACSKAIDEFLGLAYHREYNIPITIVRLFNTVGPRQVGQYGMVIPRFVQQALAGKDITVYGDGNQSRCFTYVEDVISALIKLMATPAAEGDVFNIGSDEEISIMELARRIKAKTDSASKIVTIPYDQAYEKGFDDMTRRVPYLGKINKVIGYAPTFKLEQILERVIEYHKSIR
ncbi:MAG: NAD-dependent epimerase/dehydratase family protein [Candidatus Auribacter fodinae]|jgi:UDP-glucose 4-epimerase|uniref:UDP-glucuronate decarboxylase n=1 Tax=Candidatus Auribacter fodinae TaxID=2093366 RepID=A0A3A4R018_9BACT|nr:MAG: NAD-dependent epimerase/dehydratase family protein [Candidatus Auribacter fodinae]